MPGLGRLPHPDDSAWTRLTGVYCTSCGSIWCMHTKPKQQQIVEAVASSTSFVEVAIKLQVSRPTATARVRELGLEVGHFRPGRARPYDPSKILRRDSVASRGCVKLLVLRLKLLEERCACGLVDSWQGRPLVLELDHIDGDSKNCEITNLRFLCPNCHSQTLTNKGKNAKKYKRGWKKSTWRSGSPATCISITQT